jgi:hypothetical protein
MSKRFSASERTNSETRRRRAHGVRVLVVMAACGLAGAIALGGGTRTDGDEGLQSEAPHTQSPALLELRYRREAVALTQAKPSERSERVDELLIG